MKVFKIFIAFIFAELFLYLLGAFVSASFDISTWDPGGRTFVALLGLLIGVPVAALVTVEIEK